MHKKLNLQPLKKKNLHPEKTCCLTYTFSILGSLKFTHARDSKDRLTKHLLIEKSQLQKYFKYENYFLHYPVYISCVCYYSVSLHLFCYLFIQYSLTGVSVFIFFARMKISAYSQSLEKSVSWLRITILKDCAL